MVQAPIPPGFVPPPLNWFQFAMLCLSFIVLVALALPQGRQRRILRVLSGVHCESWMAHTVVWLLLCTFFSSTFATNLLLDYDSVLRYQNNYQPLLDPKASFPRNPARRKSSAFRTEL
jgi:hypothetical protein